MNYFYSIYLKNRIIRLYYIIHFTRMINVTYYKCIHTLYIPPELNILFDSYGNYFECHK